MRISMMASLTGGFLYLGVDGIGLTHDYTDRLWE